MASVHLKQGFGISYYTDSAAQIIDLGAAMAATAAAVPAKPIQPTIPPDLMNAYPWALWGKNNLLPQEMLHDIETTGILSAILDGKARLATCQGIVPVIIGESGGQKIIEKVVLDAEINDFLELNNHFIQTYGLIRDSLGFGRPLARIGLTKKGDKIATYQRDDITETRLQKKNAKGIIENVFYSACWNLVRGADDKKNLFSVPLLNPNNPTRDLQDKLKAGDKRREFAITVPSTAWGKQYYPAGSWIPAYKWVKIAQSIPDLKAALFKNTMRVKYVVVIQEKFWENRFTAERWIKFNEKEQEEARQKVYDEINEYLAGGENAGKSLFVTGYRDREGRTWADIEIIPVEDTTKPGEYLPDSAAANSEIAIATNWNNAMSGGNQKTGLYSENQGGSNIREASTLAVILAEKERQEVRAMMNFFKYFNGWNATYKNLDFVIPGTILTTLDSGAGSKQIVNGAAAPQKKGNDQQQQETPGKK
jgi:hypothetical protein